MSTVKRSAGKPVGSVGPADLGPHADLGVAVWEAFAGTARPNTACWPLVTVSSGSTQCSGQRWLSADGADVVLVNPTDCLLYSPPLPDMPSDAASNVGQERSMAKVVRIDLGMPNSVIAAWENRKAAVLPNAECAWTTPSVVGFTENGERLVGRLARCQLILAPKKTIYSAKPFIGGRFDEVRGRPSNLRNLRADPQALQRVSRVDRARYRPPDEPQRRRVPRRIVESRGAPGAEPAGRALRGLGVGPTPRPR